MRKVQIFTIYIRLSVSRCGCSPFHVNNPSGNLNMCARECVCVYGSDSARANRIRRLLNSFMYIPYRSRSSTSIAPHAFLRQSRALWNVKWAILHNGKWLVEIFFFFSRWQKWFSFSLHLPCWVQWDTVTSPTSLSPCERQVSEETALAHQLYCILQRNTFSPCS